MRRALEGNELIPAALGHEQRRRVLAAGEVERAVLLAVEADDLTWRQHQPKTRRRCLRAVGLGDHQDHEACAVLLHEVAARRLRAELIADALNRPILGGCRGLWPTRSRRHSDNKADDARYEEHCALES